MDSPREKLGRALQQLTTAAVTLSCPGTMELTLPGARENVASVMVFPGSLHPLLAERLGRLWAQWIDPEAS